MSIHYRKDRPNKPWRAIVKHNGRAVADQSFLKEADAIRWEREQYRTLDLTGVPPTVEGLKKLTVEWLVKRYLDEVTPTKASKVNEAAVLNKFLKEQKAFCAKSLAHVSRQDAYEYRNKRLKATWKHPDWKSKARPISTTAIAREINILRHAFNLAKEEWGLSNLDNPFAAMKLKGTKSKRPNRLKEGQEEILLEATQRCLGLNRVYVPLAISFALDTGMRTQEVFNLRWKDIDAKNREITIAKSKTDYLKSVPGRVIAMPPRTLMNLGALFSELERQNKAPSPNDLIFPMTKGAFGQSFADVVKRSGIEDLQYRDLRREAASRFDQVLTAAERDLMLGHTKDDMSSIYVRPSTKPIVEKLDREFFGKPLTELLEEHAKADPTELDQKLRGELAKMDRRTFEVFSFLSPSTMERISSGKRS